MQNVSALACLLLGIHVAQASLPAGLRETLAEFETGAIDPKHCAADHLIGRQKEVSRFQILPTLWQQYSKSGHYEDPQTAWAVAAKILTERRMTYSRATQRSCDNVDIYLLWNAPGQYQRANWDRKKVSRAVLERAHRFARLMEARTRALAGDSVARN